MECRVVAGMNELKRSAAGTVLGVASRRRLGPLPQHCRGWTPRLPAPQRLHGLRPPAGGCAALGGPPRKARLPLAGAAPPGRSALVRLGLRRPAGRRALGPFGSDLRFAQACQG